MVLAGMQMPDNMGPEYTEAFRAVFRSQVGLQEDRGVGPLIIHSPGQCMCLPLTAVVMQQ